MNTFGRVISGVSDVRRRELLLSLRDEDELSPLPTRDEDCELRIQLHHTHLPKLEENGFITWDPATGVVRREPNFGAIEPLLALFEDHRHELPRGLHQWE